jgi:uncharacterized protein YcgL (UPF0745 family)
MFFRSIINLIREVKIVLSLDQRDVLVSSDLTRVKEIQGTTGVHVILDPQSEDLSRTLSCFDLR